MIKVNICGAEKDISDITDSWIYEQILNRRNRNVSVWIKVTIHDHPIRMSLSSSSCPRSNAAYRLPNRQEKEIFDLWDFMGLSDGEIDPKALIRFLYKMADSTLKCNKC